MTPSIEQVSNTANKETHLVHESYHRQSIWVLQRLLHRSVLLVPVDQVDLHGVLLAVYRVLAALTVLQAPVPVELGKLERGIRWEAT